MRDSFGESSEPILIKIHEIIFVWSTVLLAFHFVFTNFLLEIENVEYLQWVATAFSIILISKHILACANSTLTRFMGAPLQRKDLPELGAVLLISVILGLGCWAGLVIVEANVNLERTFARWGLISPETFAQIRWSSQWIFLDLISGALVVPITEEIVFRGFVLHRLRQKFSTRAAIMISALIFAIFHLNKSFIGSFTHGIIFAVLAIRFSSLYAPMLVHGLYNAAVFILETSLGIFISADKARISSANYWIVELLCLAIGMVFLIGYLRNVNVIGRASSEPVTTMAL
jgi:membrane protease YdiL (CAAX protease family)